LAFFTFTYCIALELIRQLGLPFGQLCGDGSWGRELEHQRRVC